MQEVAGSTARQGASPVAARVAARALAAKPLSACARARVKAPSSAESGAGAIV